MTDEELDRTVAELEGARLQAMEAGDLTALAALLDDALIYIHSTALKDDKAAYLKLMETGALIYHRFEPVETNRLAIGDDLILLSGRIRMDIDWSGTFKALDNVYIASWVRRPGKGWQFLTWQSTAVPPPAV